MLARGRAARRCLRQSSASVIFRLVAAVKPRELHRPLEKAAEPSRGRDKSRSGVRDHGFQVRGGPLATLLLQVFDVRREERCQKARSEEHTSELQSHVKLVCRLLLE